MSSPVAAHHGSPRRSDCSVPTIHHGHHSPIPGVSSDSAFQPAGWKREVTHNSHNNTAPDNTDYGYDASGNDAAPPDEGTTEPAQPSRRPRRRCSVTKYSLVSNATEGSAESEMAQQIQHAEMMQQFRNGRSCPLQPTNSGYSMASSESFGMYHGETSISESEQLEGQVAPVKERRLSKFRKRLSMLGSYGGETSSPESEQLEEEKVAHEKKGKLSKLRKRLSMF
jgi:hypothetical protein